MLQRWPPRLVSVALLVLIGIVSWNGITGWRVAQTDMVVPAVQKAMPSSDKYQTDLVDRLINTHLFGTVAPHATPSVALPSNWQVIGVVAAADPAASVADIKVHNSEHLWHVGDHLPDGSVLKTITFNSVTLNRNGNLRILPFELRPAADDAHFATLPVAYAPGGGKIAFAPSAPVAKAVAVPAYNQMATLRAAALRVWAARTHHAPP